MENNNYEVIGIDHGWSMIKTSNDVFVTGIKEDTKEPPLFHDILEYEGKYYMIGGERLTVRNNKTENENYYYLTLAGIAKELKRRNKHSGNIVLAAGLPIARFGDEKEDFTAYLKKKKEIFFKFEKEDYHIKFANVVVFPQCYSAVVDRLHSFPDRVVVVDIGSWTIDIVPMKNRTPVTSECISIPNGLITCMHTVNNECYKQLGEQVEEDVIQSIMRFGKADIDDEFLKVIRKEITNYMDVIYNALREHGVNLKTTPVIFCGGGAAVMKNFGNLQQKNIHYVLDIKANAKGFEFLANMGLKKKLSMAGDAK